MTPLEFYSAYDGQRKKRVDDYKVKYFLMQQQAMWGAWSTKQASAIKRNKSPWEKGKNKEPIKAETAMNILNLIAR